MGFDLKTWASKPGKRIVINEVGLGGGVDPCKGVPAASPEEAGMFGWAGTGARAPRGGGRSPRPKSAWARLETLPPGLDAKAFAGCCIECRARPEGGRFSLPWRSFLAGLRPLSTRPSRSRHPPPSTHPKPPTRSHPTTPQTPKRLPLDPRNGSLEQARSEGGAVLWSRPHLLNNSPPQALSRPRPATQTLWAAASGAARRAALCAGCQDGPRQPAAPLCPAPRRPSAPAAQPP